MTTSRTEIVKTVGAYGGELTLNDLRDFVERTDAWPDNTKVYCTNKAVTVTRDLLIPNGS